MTFKAAISQRLHYIFKEWLQDMQCKTDVGDLNAHELNSRTLETIGVGNGSTVI